MHVWGLAAGVAAFVLIAATMAGLLLVRTGGRFLPAWAALRYPGAWRWPLRAALLGLLACAAAAALALPRVFAAGCEEAVGAEWIARGAMLLAVGFALAAALCLAARAAAALAGLAPEPGSGHPRWLPEAGRGAGLAGLLCLAAMPACAVAALWPVLGGGTGALAFRTAAADRAGLLCPRPEPSVAAVPVPPAPPAPSGQERLLTEMRDLLRDMARDRRAAAVSLPAPPIPPRVEPPRPDPRASLRRPLPSLPRGEFYYGSPTDY